MQMHSEVALKEGMVIFAFLIPETEETLAGYGYFAGYPDQAPAEMVLIRKFTEFEDFQRIAQLLMSGSIKGRDVSIALP